MSTVKCAKKPFVTIHQIGFVHLIIKAEVQFKLFIMREREREGEKEREREREGEG